MAKYKHEDKGGVPRTLIPKGYRSVSPAVGVSSGIGLAVIVGAVMWPLFSHQQASAEPMRIESKEVSQPITVPVPTTPPVQETPHPRQVIRHIKRHPRKIARLSYMSTPAIYSVPQPVSYPAPVQMQPMQPVQPVVDERAQELAEAQNANSDMDLRDSNQEQGQYAVDRQERPSNAIRMASDEGNIGYETPASRYQLTMGTVIHCRLATAIDSTIPGGIVKAIVSENVFDSLTHSVLVIPQGTVVIGSTEQTQSGQARLIVDMKYFQFANGQTFNAGENEGAGLQGENGMPVKVDTHAGRAFGASITGSLLQAGINLAGRASTLNISTMGNVTQPQQLTPTMHAKVGQPFDIYLQRNEPFNRYVERS